MSLVAHIFLLLLAPTAEPAASPALAACQALAKNDPVGIDRCLTHVKYFETAPDLILACAKFSPGFDARFRCLKSGANLEAFHLCDATGWRLETKLSCLRAYPSKETMRTCRRQGGKEEDQLDCVRLGRD
jgi:hypothetical protein